MFFIWNDYTVKGNRITWSPNIKDAEAAGINNILFGAGVGISTDGVGSPPTDGGWWISQVQEYYENPVAVDLADNLTVDQVLGSPTKPNNTPNTEPVTNPTNTPNTEPVTDPNNNPNTEPVTDPTNNPTNEPVIDPTNNPDSSKTPDYIGVNGQRDVFSFTWNWGKESVIDNFNPSEDTIDLKNFWTNYKSFDIVQDGNNTVIDLSGINNQKIILQGILPSQLSSDNITGVAGQFPLTNNPGGENTTAPTTPSLPKFSINNVSVLEGNTGNSPLTFTVQISAASKEVVTVNYTTEDNTAIAGTDYIAKNSTLTFNSDVALTYASRETFAKSAVEFMTKYGFDGIDIDWEYPVSGGLAGNTYRPEDKHNYTLLLGELDKQLQIQEAKDNKDYLLTIAAPAGFDKIQNYELAAMSQHLDFFNVMTYDYHGAWENTTNHNAPLYANPNDPSAVASQYNIDSIYYSSLPISRSTSR